MSEFFRKYRWTVLLPLLLLLVFLIKSVDFFNPEDEEVRNEHYPLLLAGEDLTEEDLDQLNIDVRLLLAEKCFKCHNSTKHKAALILDTKEGIFEGGENGAIIIPGQSKQSEIIRRVTLSSRNEDAMPPEGDRLSREEVALLSLWIDEGAHWADTTLKLFREAPIDLRKPELPAATASLSHPVDIWVDQYFQEHDLDWPSQVDDRLFIRKAYLDITGKLPTSEETLEFIDNAATNKYEKIVDDLLADQQNYAIHWLSFWNDLLRNDYTGTGFITGGRQQITEWLFQALYDNNSYNDMVQSLVDPDSLSAGFIKGIQWRGVVNASQRTEIQAAQNVSQSLLGLNLKCASCHNSFVNNVSLDQAYAFANVFADSAMQIYQCDKPTGRYTSTAFIYPELGPIQGDSVAERLSSLAEIMTSPENGRIYRTLVNRYWDRFLGRGLVGSVDDMDQVPWSQDLLDWLAADFIEHDTDLKYLIKLLLTSRTYRLQPVDLKPEEITKSDFIFQGPLLRRLTAEQFLDAFSDVIHPFYSGVYFTAAPPEGSPLWIWHREIEVDRDVLPKPGIRYFRKNFDLKNTSDITRAEVMVTADSSFELFLNGEKIISGNDLRKVQKITIEPSLFGDRNCFAIKAENDGKIANPAGILLTLKIEFPDAIKYIISDKSWISTDLQPEHNWQEINYLDTSWDRVKSYGEMGYWGYLVDFRFDSRDNPPARAALTASDPLSLALGRPTRENVTTRRSDEATLLQAMMLSSDEQLAENIRRGAAILKDSPLTFTEIINRLYLNLLGRMPTKSELKIFDQMSGENELEKWEDIIWSVIMLPEFHLI